MLSVNSYTVWVMKISFTKTHLDKSDTKENVINSNDRVSLFRPLKGKYCEWEWGEGDYGTSMYSELYSIYIKDICFVQVFAFIARQYVFVFLFNYAKEYAKKYRKISKC